MSRSAAAWISSPASSDPTGSWLPLWLGNVNFPDGESPVYGTAQALLAYRDLDQIYSPRARRGLEWLAGAVDPG